MNAPLENPDRKTEMHSNASPDAAISIGHVQLMTQFMQAQGIVLSEVFNAEQLSIISDATQRSRSQIPAVQLATMLRQLAQHINDPDVVLEIASMVTTAHLGIVGYLLHACETLAEALYSLNRYNKLIVNAVEFMQIEQQQENIRLSWCLGADKDSIVMELGIAIMMQFTHQLINRPLDLVQINLIKADTPHHRRYQDFFGCRVQFGQPQMSVIFSAKNLQIPIIKPDKTLLAILQQQADIALQSLPKLDDFMYQVHQQLALQCQRGQPTIEQLAAALCLSVRTLQRRLSFYGMTFQAVLDQVRHQLCNQYLSQHIQLSDIAQLLGYSDQSAFTRAFKRWTGTTPLQQRRSDSH